MKQYGLVSPGQFLFVIEAPRSVLKRQRLLMFLLFLYLPYPMPTDVGWLYCLHCHKICMFPSSSCDFTFFPVISYLHTTFHPEGQVQEKQHFNKIYMIMFYLPVWPTWATIEELSKQYTLPSNHYFYALRTFHPTRK